MENQILVSTFLLSPEWMLLVSILAYAWLRVPISKIMGTFNARTTILGGLIIFSQLLLVSVAIDQGTTFLGLNDTQNVEAFAQSIRSQGAVGGVTLVLSAGIEELFFRGILFTILGSIPSILLFGLFHAGYFSLVEVAAALSAGVVLVHARKTYGSIFPGMVGHALYNLVIIFLFTR
jgi:membrane protease YdiL (CAAX protease family)